MEPTDLGAGGVTRWAWGLSVLALSACGPWTPDPDGFTEQEWALVRTMALPATHPGAPAAGSITEFGQRLFYDPSLSAPIVTSYDGQPTTLGAVGQSGAVACADCHDPRGWFSDIRSSPNNVSLGVQWTGRNAPSLLNVAQYKSWAWDGRGDSLQMQVAVAYEAKKTMSGTPLRLARALYADPRRRDQYAAMGLSPALSPDLDPSSPNAARFGALPDGGTAPVPASEQPYLTAVAQNAYAAMADYLNALSSTGSAFDAFALEGNRDAMDADAKAGLKLFLGKAGCVECHRGPQFTDNLFHVLGVPQRGEHVPGIDDGRYDGINSLNASPYKIAAVDPPTDADRGAFRTKSLRNVAHTGPWMHAGQFDSLEEVVRYYNAGGDRSSAYQVAPVLHPLELTDDEQRQVVAFLHALDGEAIPEALGCGDLMLDGGSRFPVCK